MRKSLWNDCNGGIITTELLLISSVVVAGLLAALGTFRSSVESEFEQLGDRIKQSTKIETTPAAVTTKAGTHQPEVKSFGAADLSGLLE